MKKIEPKDFVPFVPTPNAGAHVTTFNPEPGKMHTLDELEPETRFAFTTAMIELPIVEELPPNLNIARHVNMQLSRSEGLTLRRLLIGAQDGPEPIRLKGGRFVQNCADVVRLLLEKAGGG